MKKLCLTATICLSGLLLSSSLLGSSEDARAFKLLTFNIDTNIWRVEGGAKSLAYRSHPEWQIKHRLAPITKFLAQRDPDIATMQELRNFTNSEGELVDSLHPLLTFLQGKGYETVEAPYNPTSLAFRYLTVFKSERFRLIKSFSYYLTKTPATPTVRESLDGKNPQEAADLKAKWREHNFGEEWERSVLVTLLQDKVSGHPLFVLNVHLGMGLPHRLASSGQLIQLANSLLAELPQASLVAAGDFNSFPDWGGPQQVAATTSTPLANGAYLSDLTDSLSLPNGEQLRQTWTFIPYPYDFAARTAELVKAGVEKQLEAINDPQARKEAIHKVYAQGPAKGGHLDHIFAYGLKRVGQAILAVAPTLGNGPLDYEEASLKDYILRACKDQPAFCSDHQPVEVTLRF